MSKHGEPTGHW